METEREKRLNWLKSCGLMALAVIGGADLIYGTVVCGGAVLAGVFGVSVIRTWLGKQKRGG